MVKLYALFRAAAYIKIALQLQMMLWLMFWKTTARLSLGRQTLLSLEQAQTLSMSRHLPVCANALDILLSMSQGHIPACASNQQVAQPGRLQSSFGHFADYMYSIASRNAAQHHWLNATSKLKYSKCVAAYMARHAIHGILS